MNNLLTTGWIHPTVNFMANKATTYLPPWLSGLIIEKSKELHIS